MTPDSRRPSFLGNFANAPRHPAVASQSRKGRAIDGNPAQRTDLRPGDAVTATIGVRWAPTPGDNVTFAKATKTRVLAPTLRLIIRRDGRDIGVNLRGKAVCKASVMLIAITMQAHPELPFSSTRLWSVCCPPRTHLRSSARMTPFISSLGTQGPTSGLPRRCMIRA